LGGIKKTIAKCTAAEQGKKEEKRRKVNNITIPIIMKYCFMFLKSLIT
jgi:hypothetical protein